MRAVDVPEHIHALDLGDELAQILVDHLLVLPRNTMSLCGSLQAGRKPQSKQSIRGCRCAELTVRTASPRRSPSMKPDVARADPVPAIRAQRAIAACVENQRPRRLTRTDLQIDDMTDHDLVVSAIIPCVDTAFEAGEPRRQQRRPCYPWTDIDLEQRTLQPSTTRSARGCHPCLRYVLSPMCPGRTLMTLILWRRGRDSNPRYGCPYAAFRVRCDRPLCHLSVAVRA